MLQKLSLNLTLYDVTDYIVKYCYLCWPLRHGMFQLFQPYEGSNVELAQALLLDIYMCGPY
jgi:hypothetical protein